MIVQSTLFIKDAIIYRHHHHHHQLCRLLLRLLRERVSLNFRHPLWIKSLYVLSVFITATKPSSSSNYKFRRFSRGFQNGCIVKWKSHPPELRSSLQSAIQVWWYMAVGSDAHPCSGDVNGSVPSRRSYILFGISRSQTSTRETGPPT